MTALLAMLAAALGAALLAHSDPARGSGATSDTADGAGLAPGFRPPFSVRR